jgi:hypothetical protein
MIIERSLLIFILLSSLILQVDRSRTNYVLSWISEDLVKFKNGHYITSINNPEALNSVAIEQRLVEHEHRKFLKIEGERVSLTFLGSLALSVSSRIGQVYNLRGWKKGITNMKKPHR